MCFGTSDPNPHPYVLYTEAAAARPIALDDRGARIRSGSGGSSTNQGGDGGGGGGEKATGKGLNISTKEVRRRRGGSGGGSQ